MSKYFMSWSELNGVEKVSTVVTVVGLVGGWTILLLGQPLIGCVVVTSTMVVEFVLWRISQRGGLKMTKNKTPPMHPEAKELIKKTSSAYVRADMAGRRKEHDAELKHLLQAIRGCYELLILYQSGWFGVDKELALSYAKSGEKTAKRIEELVEGGKER